MDNQNTNLVLWNNWRTPPKEALKPIKGGRLNGMTDISPIWRYSVLTKAFGPCGTGWFYTIDKEWKEEAGEEIHCYVQISLYYSVDSEEGRVGYSQPVCALGGSKILAQERSGKHASDEAYKMALTDALSVACKMLGIGADVYWSEGGKYTSDAANKPEDNPEEKPNGKPNSKPNFTGMLNAFLIKYGISKSDFVKYREQLISEGTVSDTPSTQLDETGANALFDAVLARHSVVDDPPEAGNGNP